MRSFRDAADKFSQAVSLVETGDDEGAIVLLTESLTLNPDFPPAYRYRADAYQRIGRVEDARADLDRLESFKEVEQIEPQNADRSNLTPDQSSHPDDEQSEQELNDQRVATLLMDSKWLRRVVAAQIRGGCFGILASIFILGLSIYQAQGLGPFVTSFGPVSISFPVPLPAVAGLALSILAIVAGRRLWRYEPSGVRLSLWVQALQIPQFSLIGLSYVFIAGLFLAPRGGAFGFSLDFGLGGMVNIMGNAANVQLFGSNLMLSSSGGSPTLPSQPSDFVGLNLIPVALFVYLARKRLQVAREYSNNSSHIMASKSVIVVIAMGVILSGAMIYMGTTSFTNRSVIVASNSTLDVPSDQVLRGMTTNTLLALDAGVRLADFASFYNTNLSEQWKAQTTPDALKEAFQSFIDNDISIIGIKDVSLVFDAPPAVDEQGLLTLSGYYPTRPVRVLFTLQYEYEHPSWQLMSISVELR